MKLRKKVLSLVLAAMTTISASLTIASNAAKNYTDTYQTIDMHAPVSGAWTGWRQKLSDSYIYLKITGLGSKNCKSTKVDVCTEGSSNNKGLTQSNNYWKDYSYDGFPFDWFFANNGENNYTLGNGEYFLWNLVYETSPYGQKPCALAFGTYTYDNAWDYHFNIAWSPDCIGSAKVIY